ncbi:uncharacterized protein LOC131689754 [Topomyia yanbarensis]|uniref:uncharacterized protein LOC131689754 n=1 Tax=Topomyia yanbarensis TaxID=2498891 RepID=UPI00273AAAA1|nr:uncharacterized protein LOC131689754 [Topomyia yanbarensis]
MKKYPTLLKLPLTHAYTELPTRNEEKRQTEKNIASDVLCCLLIVHFPGETDYQPNINKSTQMEAGMFPRGTGRFWTDGFGLLKRTMGTIGRRNPRCQSTPKDPNPNMNPHLT